MSKRQLTHDAYWNHYIDLAPDDDVVRALEQQGSEFAALLSGISEERSNYRYAPDKWSIRELAVHVADTERIFGYRSLSIARGDTRSLLGFDEKLFATNADADARPFRDIVEEFAAVRRATVAMFRGFSDAAWERVGTANGSRINVASLAHVTLGHARHHANVLRERYVSGG